MITISAATAAITVAQEFDKRGLMLEATPGTLLASLNDTFALVVADINKQPDYTPDPVHIQNMSNDWRADVTSSSSSHTTAIDAAAKEIAGFVQQHLNFAKNVVRPVIEELVKEVSADIEALPTDAQFDASIIVYDLPEPMLQSSFEDAVMVYKDVNYAPVTTYLALPGMDAVEIAEKIKTGHSSMDDALAIWVAKKGDSFLQNVYDSVFTSQPTETRFESLIKDPLEGADAAIAVYLLCTKLFDNPPEGTKQSLVTYNKQIADLRNQAALRIVNFYSEYTRSKTTGLLIKSSLNNKLVVIGDTYRDWIEAGGTNAILFGSILSSRPGKYVNDINERKTEFLSSWERQNWILTVAHRNKRFVHYKEILKNRTLKVVSDSFKQCYSHLKPDGITDPNMPEYIKFKTNLDTYMDTVTENGFKNIWSLAQDVVCKTVFYYTDADKILSGIERACNDNPGIDIREAALISTIEYITDYVSDQIKVGSI